MDIVIKSLASAGVTAIILLIAKNSGPKLAGALGGIPIVFAITYILVTHNNKGESKDFLVGGIYGALAAILFSFLLIGLNSSWPKYYWANFIFAYVLCFLFALGLAHFTSK
ncbi:MAG: hypothetical protein AAB588_03915 [Patescibacteria group bacterium]